VLCGIFIVLTDAMYTAVNLTLQTLDANTLQRLSQNHANLFNSYRINPYPCFHGMLVADSGPLSVFKINK